jgi:hypothetical protein
MLHIGHIDSIDFTCILSKQLVPSLIKGDQSPHGTSSYDYNPYKHLDFKIVIITHINRLINFEIQFDHAFHPKTV